MNPPTSADATESALLAKTAPYRGALEPVLGLCFGVVWTLASLATAGLAEFSVIVLLAAAVGVSRLSPGTALFTGVLAVLLQVSGVVPGLPAGAWAYPVAGCVVFFAAAAWGTVVVRWVGLGSAVLLAAITAIVVALPLADVVRIVQSGTVNQVLVFGFGYVVIGGLLAALLAGAWFAGLTLNRRAPLHAGGEPDTSGAPGTSAAPETSIEAWLMQRTITALPNDAPLSRGFRRLGRNQLVIDMGIAVVFVLIGLVSTASHSVAEMSVVLVFALALAFRRLSPPVALLIAWLGAILQLSLDLGVVGSDVAVLAVLYATAAYGQRLTRWVGLASVGIGGLVAAVYLLAQGAGSLDFSNPLSQGGLGQFTVRFLVTFVASVGVLGLAWTLGLLMRTWRTARQSRRQEVLALGEQRLAQRTVVVEQERNRIARDMHDVVAHSLAVVIAQADGARYARATNPAAVDMALSTISATARAALGDVRVLLAQLRQDETSGPQPALSDLERLVEQMRSAGLTIDWTASGAPLQLGSGAQLAAYRIIQEALVNALRHGDRGWDVRLALAWIDSALNIEVTNAIPLTPDATAAGVGHGLPGMRERAVLAGGAMTTEVTDGHFTVTASIPMTTPSAVSTTKETV